MALVVVLHRIDDLEINRLPTFSDTFVLHRIDDLEIKCFFDTLSNHVLHRIDDLESLLKPLLRTR